MCRCWYETIGLLCYWKLDVGHELRGGIDWGSLSPTVTIINKPDPKTNTKLLIQVTKTGIINQKRDKLPFGLVKQALRPAKLGTSTSDIHWTALHCAADLVEAFGTLADPYLSKLVNDMFTAVLSEDIFHCLDTITASVLSRPVPAEWHWKSTFIGSIALFSGDSKRYRYLWSTF